MSTHTLLCIACKLVFWRFENTRKMDLDKLAYNYVHLYLHASVSIYTCMQVYPEGHHKELIHEHKIHTRLILLFIDLRVVFLQVSRVGIEPTTLRLLAQRANLISTFVSTPISTPVSIVNTFVRTVSTSISTVSHPLAIR